jgi:DNA-binding NarL/FixJ family response regulator
MNGIEATHRLHSEQPAIKVLCLSMHAEARFVRAALDAGATGYLLKDSAYEELVRAIRAVVAGHVYLSPTIAGIVLEDFKASRSGSASTLFSILTEREREVLQLLAEGSATKEIAERLHISLKTVSTHREHIMEKLGIHSVAGLTKYAIREGLIDNA